MATRATPQRTNHIEPPFVKPNGSVIQDRHSNPATAVGAGRCVRLRCMASRKINPWAAIAMICAAWAVRSVWANAEKAAQPAAPRSGSDDMTEAQLRASLSILDTMRQALLKLRANVPAMLPAQVMDDRGRTFADDWQA